MSSIRRSRRRCRRPTSTASPSTKTAAPRVASSISRARLSPTRRTPPRKCCAATTLPSRPRRNRVSRSIRPRRSTRPRRRKRRSPRPRSRRRRNPISTTTRTPVTRTCSKTRRASSRTHRRTTTSGSSRSRRRISISTEAAIEAEGLIKSYGDVRALDGVDLTAPTGTVLGLLGPNGAGKTTAVRILTTLLPADGGNARVAGLDVAAEAPKLRSRIGLAGQYAAVDENLTGFENLQMVGQLYHLPKGEPKVRATELLER